jgi:predicted RNA-binding Zn-ribbon protein involved in translation (DUF1610 family)
VIPKICGSCKQQVLEKLASLYWAWTNADGRRRAWKQKLCASCVQDDVVGLIVAAEQPLLVCPSCGESTVDDMDAIYLTYCLPGMPTGQSEMPTCGSCAVAIRTKALRGAVELPDRQAEAGVGVGGPQPIDAAGAWAALGLRPRGARG